jgi:hypothetical protein
MISIIILNYNTFEFTCRCIRSIYDQTKGVEFEVVLVDNASTECNPDKFLEIFPKIKVVKNTENRGFSRGCNDGIKHSKGEYMLLLNSDTVLLNDAIGITYNFLNHNEKVGIATCRLENADGTAQNNCQLFPSPWKIVGEKMRVHKLFSKKKRGQLWFGHYFNYTDLAYPDWVWGTFFMFSRKLLTIFPKNKLPETFWMYVEDMEWCWLARKAGYKVAFVPDGRVLHYGGGNVHTDKTRKMMDENFRRFISLYYPSIKRTIINTIWK